jgi:hypothetical protein
MKAVSVALSKVPEWLGWIENRSRTPSAASAQQIGTSRRSDSLDVFRSQNFSLKKPTTSC